MAKATATTSPTNESAYQPTLNFRAQGSNSPVTSAYEAPVQLRLSQHTRQLGLKHIARIKAQLAEQARLEAERANAA